MAEAGRPGNQSFPELTAVWLPPEELRRLAAYKVLSAYDNNQAGQPAAASGDEAGIERRELRDAAKLDLSPFVDPLHPTTRVRNCP
ncbi:hypothetical protein [Streptomyces hygroscopicus]|uniref:hypothetical protein n=1 Tax=Streptomyces hygroscopicus TaxID=1912 RepID=UPI0036C9CB97